MKRDANLLATGLMLLMLVGSLGGCAGPAKVTTGNAQSMAGNYDDPETEIITGKVVETMDGGGYTYVCLEKDGKKTWVAVPAMKVTVGDSLRLYPGTVMPGFTSSALNRTFSEIIFSAGPIQEKKLEAAQPTRSLSDTTGQKPDKNAKPQPPVLAGKVVEAMRVGNYTYICLEKDGRKSWSAVPATEVKVGDEIEILPGTEMGSFTSKSLKRTFENIYFSTGVKGTKVAVQPTSPPTTLPAGHPALTGKTSGQTPAEAKPAATAPKLAGKVVETMDAGGYTYICLENDGKKTWAAVPTMKVAVGNEIELSPGVEMKKFSSKTLNRTFESIVFSSGPLKK